MFSRRRWEKLWDFSANHVIYAVVTRDWTRQLGNYQPNPIVDNSDVKVDQYAWTSFLECNRARYICLILWVNIGPTLPTFEKKHRASQRCTTVYCLLKLACIRKEPPDYYIIIIFCETQWRHSVKTRSYNTPSPITHSVKRRDGIRWEQGYIRTFPHTSLY